MLTLKLSYREYHKKHKKFLISINFCFCGNCLATFSICVKLYALLSHFQNLMVKSYTFWKFEAKFDENGQNI
jgi:hypothetical protein